MKSLSSVSLIQKELDELKHDRHERKIERQRVRIVPRP
jgi:hypothetical protein